MFKGAAFQLSLNADDRSSILKWSTYNFNKYTLFINPKYRRGRGNCHCLCWGVRHRIQFRKSGTCSLYVFDVIREIYPRRALLLFLSIVTVPKGRHRSTCMNYADVNINRGKGLDHNHLEARVSKRANQFLHSKFHRSDQFSLPADSRYTMVLDRTRRRSILFPYPFR